MILCSKECDPCCDFCIHAIHEEFFLGKKHVVGGPIGCLYHKDLEHQEIAEFCGICPRTLRKYFAYYPELKYGKNFDKKNISNYVNFLRDTAGFKFAEDKEFFLKKQVDKFLKNNL